MAVAKENKVVHGNDLIVIGQEIKEALANKQNTISDLSTIRSGAAAGATAYQKSSAGIPLSDLSSSVQTSLGKADTALQSYTETDPTVPAWAKASTKPTYTASEIGALPSTTQIPSALSDLTDDSTHRTVSDTEKATWNAKQNAISDISTIRAGAAAGATAYQKPSTGIPSTDMTTAVQNSLELAVGSLQKTAQTLTAAEKAQVWNNLGIKEGVSRVVSTLPTTEIDENIVYLVPTANAGEFTEYKYNGSSWDNLGTFTVQAPTVVNDLETGGSTSALSAEMGKVLDGKASQLSQEVVPLAAVVVGEAGTFNYDCKANAAGMYFNGTAIVASTSGANGIVIPVDKDVNYKVQDPKPKIYNIRFFTSVPTIGGSTGSNANDARTAAGYTPSSDGYILVSFDAALDKIELTKGQSGIEKKLGELSTELSNFETATNSGINAIDGRLDTLESLSVLNISDSEVKLIEENVLNESDDQLTLPIIYGDGYGRFSGVSGKLYAGAANFVRLLLKPGAVTYNNVTLTIDEDGWVTMTGTASGDGVISYTNLKGYIGADTAKADLTIPEMPSGNYELAIAQRGTSSKATIYARASASSAWLALVTTTNPNVTIDASAVGAFVAYLINGTTYNEHFRFMIMPKSIYDVMPHLTAFLNDPWPVDIEMFDKDGIHIANYVLGDGSATKIEKLLPLTNYATNKVRCAWFGDSISQFMQLPHLVGRKMAISVDDCSFGGAPLAYSSEEYEDTGVCSLFEQIANNDFSPCETAINLQYSHNLITEAQRDAKLAQLAYIETIDFSEVDKVVVFAGTNDLSVSSATLANIKSYFTSATTALLTAYPQLQVYVILPIYRSDAYTTHPNGLTLPDINGAIQEVAEGFGFPCLDGLKNCGIDSVNHTHWLTDGLHQNDAGDEMLSTRFANWLKSIF